MRRSWIKIETNTPHKPEVCAVASALRIDADLVVGKLVRLWSWADLNVDSANEVGVTMDFIDRFVGRKGFAVALERVGWLEQTPTALRFPRFDRHNGQAARVRALTANRVSSHRARKGRAASGADEAGDDRPAARQQDVGPNQNASTVTNIATSLTQTKTEVPKMAANVSSANDGKNDPNALMNREVGEYGDAFEDFPPSSLPPSLPQQDLEAPIITAEDLGYAGGQSGTEEPREVEGAPGPDEPVTGEAPESSNDLETAIALPKTDAPARRPRAGAPERPPRTPPSPPEQPLLF